MATQKTAKVQEEMDDLSNTVIKSSSKNDQSIDGNLFVHGQLGADSISLSNGLIVSDGDTVVNHMTV
jgi:hypothetical protein